jgi:AbrB family looped-hinge helix DNA binding protein
MDAVTISPKFQVVIPQKIRRALNLYPGQKVQVIQYDGRVELIPMHSVKELRGFVKGIKTDVERESDRI